MICKKQDSTLVLHNWLQLKYLEEETKKECIKENVHVQEKWKHVLRAWSLLYFAGRPRPTRTPRRAGWHWPSCKNSNQNEVEITDKRHCWDSHKKKLLSSSFYPTLQTPARRERKNPLKFSTRNTFGFKPSSLYILQCFLFFKIRNLLFC